MPEFRRASFFSRTILNTPIKLAARLGLSLGGANLLTTHGRKSGTERSVPVNPLEFGGQRYLLAPRGETFWVRNARANPEATLQLGRKKRRVRLTEVPDVDKPPLIAAYLERWGSVTRSQFGTDQKEPDQAELERLAARTPVFRVE